MKKFIAILLVVALTASVSVTGTMAYLTSEDDDVNVMTLGNVKIEQIEQERDASGNLVDFTQAKPAYPAVGPVEWADTGVNVNGTEYKVFSDDLKNVIDKIVTVKNTGISDAYVRTIVAMEAPEGDPNNLIHVNVNGSVDHTTWTRVEINGVDYVYSVFTYAEALAPGEISAPSLLQVFLDSAATNEDVAKFGDSWEILVVSQAMQTQGFDDAETALNTAFGAPEALNESGEKNVVVWFSDMSVPTLVQSAQELRDAMQVSGANIVLGGDIIVTGEDTTGYGQHMFLANGKSCTINLNSHNITVSEDASQVGSLFSTANGGSITIEGNGDVEIKNGKAFVAWSMNDTDQINVYGGNFFGNGHVGNNALFYVQAGKIDVYGGKFTYPVADNDNWGFNARDVIGNKLVIEIHEGALLQHEAFQYGDNSRIQLAEGCTLQEVEIDGTTWYKVVKA